MVEQEQCLMMPDPDPDAGTAMRHVFVYGTLRAGGSNDITRWRPAPLFVDKGIVRGTLYDFGGWPGLRPESQDEPGGIVHGEVYRIDPALEPLLDRLEGVRDDGNGEYIKRVMGVLVSGRNIDCLVYQIQARTTVGRPAIANGDWIAHAATTRETS